MPGRADLFVMRDSIVAGVMQVMSPVVDLFRPGISPFPIFDFRLPIDEECHTAWGQNPHEFFIPYHVSCIPYHYQIHEIVGIGKMVFRPILDGDLAIKPAFPNVSAGLLNGRFASAQSLDKILLVCVQGGG